MCEVTKRDGRKVPFQAKKIENAMLAAFKEVSTDRSDMLLQFKVFATSVAKDAERAAEIGDVSVEQLQDFVVKSLMTSYPTVGVAYQRYREERTKIREASMPRVKSTIGKMEEILLVEGGEQLNANVDDRVWTAKMNAISETMVKDFCDHTADKVIIDNHNNMRVYIHDKGMWSGKNGLHNCLQMDFENLFKNHLKTKQIELGMARSFDTACQLGAVAFGMQSTDQYGGVAAMIDFAFQPFLRLSFWKHYKIGLEDVEDFRTNDYDWDDNKIFDTSIEDEVYKKHPKAYTYAMKRTKREVDQGLQSLWCNLGSMAMRSGHQVAFSSISCGLNTTVEGRMITRSAINTVYEGYGEFHRTYVFPCFIFELKDGINKHEGEPNYDLFKLAQKCTARRLYPNYANCDAPMQKIWHEKDRTSRREMLNWISEGHYGVLIDRYEEHPEWFKEMRITFDGNHFDIVEEEDWREVYQTMGCRTATSYDVNANDAIYNNIMHIINNDFEEHYDGVWSGILKTGRGNCNPVTLILPVLAMESTGEVGIKDVDKFMQILEKTLEEATYALHERYQSVISAPPSIAPFMYDNRTCIGYDGKTIESAMKHFTNAVGQVGLSECLKILIGADHTTDEGMALAIEIEELYTKKCKEATEKYGIPFGCYYTPAESTAGKAMEFFKNKFGEIDGITDHEYFTNSIHVPVWCNINPFEKCDIESKLSNYGVAGNIFYVEATESLKNNIDALEQIVMYAMNNGVPYMGINVPLDKCLSCGFDDGEFDECPVCGEKTNIERLKRQTGK